MEPIGKQTMGRRIVKGMHDNPNVLHTVLTCVYMRTCVID